MEFFCGRRNLPPKVAQKWRPDVCHWLPGIKPAARVSFTMFLCPNSCDLSQSLVKVVHVLSPVTDLLTDMRARIARRVIASSRHPLAPFVGVCPSCSLARRNVRDTVYVSPSTQI